MNPVFRVSTPFLLAVLVSTISGPIGCKSSTPSPTPTAEAAQTTAPTAAPTQAGDASQPAEKISVADLVAPIALYPDQLLAQVLTASTNAQEVLDGGNWLIQNQNLKGDALTNAAKAANFSPSMQYLTAFPDVVDNMCQQMDWTTQLGQAFQADQKGVMSAIQQKRAEAQQVGNLKSSPQMTVTQKTDNNQQYVEIQPANPQVVYVPAYDPVTIYNTPAPAAPATTTMVTTEQKSGVSGGTAAVIGLLSFGAGMAVGSTFHNDDYYPYPRWGYGGVYAGGRPYYPPPYHPGYPGYRPAYGYHPPSNYGPYNYNHSVNSRYNNNSYGRYNNNSVHNNNVNVNVNNNRNNQANVKGSYQGARPNENNGKPGASMANANPRKDEKPGASLGNSNQRSNDKPGAGMANANPRNQEAANRPNAANKAADANRPNSGNGNVAANRPSAGNSPVAANRPNAGSGPAGGNAAASRDLNKPANATATNRAAASPAASSGGDRGFGNSGSGPRGGSAPAARPTPQQAQSHAGTSSSAFSKSGSASSEKAASNRGQASVSGGGGGAKGRKK